MKTNQIIREKRKKIITDAKQIAKYSGTSTSAVSKWATPIVGCKRNMRAAASRLTSLKRQPFRGFPYASAGTNTLVLCTS